jgi:hypothetical protein
MIETAMKITEQFENFQSYTKKEVQDISAQIKQRKAECEQNMATLERRISLNDRQISKSAKNDSTCVVSDCYS